MIVEQVLKGYITGFFYQFLLLSSSGLKYSYILVNSKLVQITVKTLITLSIYVNVCQIS